MLGQRRHRRPRGWCLHDGSGLSRRNRISPATLVETVRVAASTPRTSGLLADLPVSGFTGTLVGRFAELESRSGTVRAKTGTLTGVHSLAGYALDADGRPVVFAVMADRTDKAAPLEAQAALDRVAAAIAGCPAARATRGRGARPASIGAVPVAAKATIHAPRTVAT